ncbi:MAG: MBL fold metallo-hydrolase [Phycisphaerales bacterium JB041]
MAQSTASDRAAGVVAQTVGGVSRRGFLAAAGCAAGAAALSPAALARAAAAGRLGAGTYFPWVEVGKGVHAVIDLSTGGNVMVVSGRDAALMVDTKYPAFAAALLREGSAFGAPVTHVLNTHHHGDHTGGNGVLKGRVEALIAHEKALPRIEGQVERYAGSARGGPRQVEMGRDGSDAVLEEAQAALEAAGTWGPADVVPGVALSGEREVLTVDGIEIVAHHFGAGHTDNDVIVQVVEANVIHTGDTCFHGLHPFFDQSGGVTCRGWSEVVGKIIELCDGDTVVVPGHGEVTDRSGLEAQRRYLDRLWESVSKEVAKGTAKEDVAAMSWDFMDGLGFEQVRSRAIGAVYDEVVASGD